MSKNVLTENKEIVKRHNQNILSLMDMEQFLEERVLLQHGKIFNPTLFIKFL